MAFQLTKITLGLVLAAILPLVHSRYTTTTTSLSHYTTTSTSHSISTSISHSTTTSTGHYTTTTTTSSIPSPTATIPASCASTVPTALNMTTFSWFNSTHNLDCVRHNYPDNSTVCWNATSLCAAGSAGCSCTPFCYTGLSNAAYTPLGYGPQDAINITVGGRECARPFPIGFRDNELGEGHFDCGSAADMIGFVGDSNADRGGVGSVYYNAYYADGVAACDGKVARYQGSFALECVRDQGGNATCTTPKLPVVLPFAGWAN